jgi:5-methylthioadenosine/S-adenosylhomocysteine deaminase
MKILSAKYLLTMSSDPVVDGAVAIEGDEIIDVGREEYLLKRYPNAQHEDYSECVIMPGLINCHTHLDMSLYQNFECDPVRNQNGVINFIDWLTGCIKYKKQVTTTQQAQAVDWAVEQCIQNGTTCIADMSTFEGMVPLLNQKHLRAVLFPEVMSIGTDVAKDLFESAMAIIEKYLDSDSDLVTVGAGPYAPYMLSRSLLRIMSQYSRSSNIPLMIHVAESFPEMEFFHNSAGDIATKLFPCIGWDELPPEHQKTPVQHLSQIGFLEAMPLLVGCTQVTTKDLDHIAQTGSKIVITPRSHMNLQQGKVPFKEINGRRILTVLGTDGIPSVETLSLWDEMRAFVRQHADVVPLSGYDVLSMVTSRAAKALGLGDELGVIEKGRKADLILIDTTSIAPSDDFFMGLIQGVSSYHIKSVIIGGQVVKSVN